MELTIHDEVEIVPRTPAGSVDLRPIRGRLGAVTGISRAEADGRIVAYAVAVDGEAEVWMAKPADLRPTGGRRRHEDYMSGLSIRVSQDGRVVG